MMSRNRTGWNEILKMSEEDDDPMINMDDIEDDDDQLLDLENSLKEYAKANVYVLLVVIIFISDVILEISYFIFSFLRYLRIKNTGNIKYWLIRSNEFKSYSLHEIETWLTFQICKVLYQVSLCNRINCIAYSRHVYIRVLQML